jgi:hypothetical protein
MSPGLAREQRWFGPGETTPLKLGLGLARVHPRLDGEAKGHVARVHGEGECPELVEVLRFVELKDARSPPWNQEDGVQHSAFSRRHRVGQHVAGQRRVDLRHDLPTPPALPSAGPDQPFRRSHEICNQAPHDQSDDLLLKLLGTDRGSHDRSRRSSDSRHPRNPQKKSIDYLDNRCPATDRVKSSVSDLRSVWRAAGSCFSDGTEPETRSSRLDA